MRSKNAASAHTRDWPWVPIEISNTYVAAISQSYMFVLSAWGLTRGLTPNCPNCFGFWRSTRQNVRTASMARRLLYDAL